MIEQSMELQFDGTFLKQESMSVSNDILNNEL
jgi:hypothetical protein